MHNENQNAAVYFVDRHAGGAAGARAAFVEGFGEGRSISYGDLATGTGRVAGMLRRHGIRQEDRAAMLVLDQIEFPVIFWGCLKAGVVPIALNTLLSTDVYNVILADSRARVLFVSHELLPSVRPLLAGHPHVEKVFVIGGPQSHGMLDFAAELAPAPVLDAIAVKGDECAFWLYSSGSTGQPKGVRHLHSNLRATSDTYGAQVLEIGADDRILSAAKLFFAYGLGNGMTFPMSVGATAILFNGRPTPDSMAEVMERTRPTIFCGVPTLYAAMVHKMQAEGRVPDAPLRRCISAGEALPEEIGKGWARLWNVDILDGVGSTELLHIFLSNAPGDVVYGTSGTAVPGYELRLVDEAGNDVPAGEVGELIVQGHSAAEGYWNQRSKSRETFEGCWTRTGDKYTRTPEGRFVYCGRTDDMFKVSGIWVSPFEVEQALIAHSAVLEAAVIARRDDEGLEKPMAFVVLKDGAGEGIEAALREHVKDRIGKWKYPRWIAIVDDLPKTATGKIQRFKLRETA